MVNIAVRDAMSTTGSNARLLEDVSGTDPWSMGKYSLKQKLVLSEMVEVPEQDTWRIMYLDKLLKERQAHYYQGSDDEVQRVSGLIESLCTT